MATISDKKIGQRAALEEMQDLVDALGRKMKGLWKLHDQEFGADDEYIRDGGFTEAGRKRLRAMLADGKRNVEIAEFFGVTDAAIAYHRKRWRQLEGARHIGY